MSNNETWNREEGTNKYFDPDNVEEWLKYSPEEFIAVLINEIRQESEAIGAWAKMLDQNPEFRNQTFHFNNQEITAPFITDVFMRSARIITRLLNTAGAYRAAVSKK